MKLAGRGVQGCLAGGRLILNMTCDLFRGGGQAPTALLLHRSNRVVSISSTVKVPHSDDLSCHP